MAIYKDVNKLQEPFKTKVLLWLCEVGDLIFITEAVRTKTRQQELYDIGRKKPGKIVTQTLKSKHIDGLAIDFAFKGKVLYPPLSDPKWKQVVDLAKAFGMKRGGDRKKFPDNPHLECNGKSITAQMKANSALYNQVVDADLQLALTRANTAFRTVVGLPVRIVG